MANEKGATALAIVEHLREEGFYIRQYKYDADEGHVPESTTFVDRCSVIYVSQWHEDKPAHVQFTGYAPSQYGVRETHQCDVSSLDEFLEAYLQVIELSKDWPSREQVAEERGKRIQALIDRGACMSCEGTGYAGADGHTCPRCEGSGSKEEHEENWSRSSRWDDDYDGYDEDY